MKQKKNARQRREAEAERRKETFSPKTVAPQTEPVQHECPKPVFRPERFPERSPEEEALEFLAYLDRYGTKGAKEEIPQNTRKKAASNAIPVLNLEEGMPLVEEAVSRMNRGIQEMRVSRVKAVKLIHGYGSTGRGGRIRAGVRNELANMKRRNLIRDFIPGEDFGPTDAAARKLADQAPSVTRDPDYGRMNHGVTIVVL